MESGAYKINRSKTNANSTVKDRGEKRQWVLVIFSHWSKAGEGALWQAQIPEWADNEISVITYKPTQKTVNHKNLIQKKTEKEGKIIKEQLGQIEDK